MSIYSLIDDKYVPLFRVLWISALPHYCGSPDCQHEGDYEVALDGGESVWASQSERDETLASLERYHNGQFGEGDYFDR